MHSPKTRDLITRQRFVSSLTLKEDFVSPLAPSFGARFAKPSFATASFETAANSYSAVTDSSESPVVPTEGKPEGYVVGRSLVSFVNNVPKQQKDDVLNSSLLAQLAADARYKVKEENQKWSKAYTEVMENIGWVMQDFQFHEIENKQSDFKLSNVILEIVSELVGGNQKIMNLLKASLDALKESTEELSLFSHRNHGDKIRSFQVVPCEVDESGQVITVFVCFLFEASQTDDDYLFWEWHSRDIKLSVGSQTCALNENLYAKLRDDVLNKLGVNGSTYIKKLVLPANLPPAGN